MAPMGGRTRLPLCGREMEAKVDGKLPKITHWGRRKETKSVHSP